MMPKRTLGGAALILLLSAALVQLWSSRAELTGIFVVIYLIVAGVLQGIRQNRAIHRAFRSIHEDVQRVRRRVEADHELVGQQDRRLRDLRHSQDRVEPAVNALPGLLTRSERQLSEENGELSRQVAALAAQVHQLSVSLDDQRLSNAAGWNRLEARDVSARHDAHSPTAATPRPELRSTATDPPGYDLRVGCRSSESAPSVRLVLEAVDPVLVDTDLRTALLAGAIVAQVLELPLNVVVLRGVAESEVTLAALSHLIVRETGDADLAQGIRLTPGLSETEHHAEDVWLATGWTAATVLSEVCQTGVTSPARVIYLVQDWEPGALAWGTEHLQAVATYHAGFTMVVESAPLAQFMSRQIGVPVPDTQVFAPLIDVEPLAAAAHRWTPVDPTRPRLLWVARPWEARDLFTVGLQALQRWADLLPSGVRPIVHVGGDSPLDLGRQVDVVRSDQTDLAAYRDLLASSDLGLTLSCSPHPGHAALELPMAGIPTVTNSLGDHRQPWVDGLRLAAPDPLALAQLLERARNDAAARRQHTPRPLPATLGRPVADVMSAAVSMLMVHS